MWRRLFQRRLTAARKARSPTVMFVGSVTTMMANEVVGDCSWRHVVTVHRSMQSSRYRYTTFHSTSRFFPSWLQVRSVLPKVSERKNLWTVRTRDLFTGWTAIMLYQSNTGLMFSLPHTLSARDIYKLVGLRSATSSYSMISPLLD